MKKSDKIIFGLILGVVFPVLFSLIAVTIGYYFYKAEKMPYFQATGLIAGIIADILFLRRLISFLFDLPAWLIAGFYVLSNVFIYGLFMGFPVFNIFMGIIAGYYYGRRIICKKIISTQREALIKKVSLFTALIMLLICISSALLALNEKTIGEELQNMLGLNFIPSRGLITSGIILGGITLIIFQYLITRTVQIKTVRANSD
jgi:hypothetical protein